MFGRFAYGVTKAAYRTTRNTTRGTYRVAKRTGNMVPTSGRPATSVVRIDQNEHAAIMAMYAEHTAQFEAGMRSSARRIQGHVARLQDTLSALPVTWPTEDTDSNGTVSGMSDGTISGTY